MSAHGTYIEETIEQLRVDLATAQRKLDRMESDKLDQAWARINAEGGRKPTIRDDYDAGLQRGYLDAVEDALAIIEDLGGMDPAQRARDNGQFGVGA